MSGMWEMADVGDMDSSSMEDDSEPRPWAGCVVKRVAFASFVLVVLVSLVALVSPSFSEREHFSGPVSVRKLLESDSLAKIVADNVAMAHLHPVDRAGLHTEVRRHATRLASSQSALAAVTGDATIADVRLSDAEQAAVLRSLSMASDPRLRGVNQAIMEAVRETLSESGNLAYTGGMFSRRDRLKQHVAERLRPHRAKMLELHNEMVPGKMRGLHTSNLDRAAPVDGFDAFENMRILRSFDDWQRRGALSEQRAHIDPDAKAIPAVGEQFRSFFALVRGAKSSAVAAPSRPRQHGRALASEGTEDDSQYRYIFGCEAGVEPETGMTCREYPDCIGCMVGEMERGDYLNVPTCIEFGISNAFEAVMLMSDKI